jgi:hypothetical protein
VMRDRKIVFVSMFCFLFSKTSFRYAITALSQGGRLKHFRIYHKPGLDYLIGKAECKVKL